MGSLEWQTHATMQRDMVKFRAWLSSHLFKEQFPAHYAEVLRALPLQEYMNPKSGLLNLAVKLPPEMPEIDLGPSIYISYGGPEEVSQAEFVTKLCCESYDVVGLIICYYLFFFGLFTYLGCMQLNIETILSIISSL